MRVIRLLALVALLAGLAGCKSSGSATPSIGKGDAYTAIVNWQVGQLGPPTTDAPLPVVYVTSEDGSTIDAGVQAKVASNTVDIAKVRFADVREDAIEANTPGEPVKDDGVLLIVDKFDGKGTTRMPVGVTVYRTTLDERHLVVTVSATEQGAEVTSSSERPSG